MNSNSTVKIYAHSNLSNLGLGDYLRIISFLPNLNYKRIIWFSDEKLFPLVKKVDFISEIQNINKINEKSVIQKNDLIFNLYQKGKNSNNIFYLQNFFSKNKNIKENTFDLYKQLSTYFKVKNYKIFSNKNTHQKKDIDIFFNWSAPKKWKIKELPKRKWIQLQNKIGKKYKKIIWQDPDDNLDQYTRKIARSKIVISIVGLGNHISTLFNIPTIILSGPTYFNEATKHHNVHVIFPRNPCDNKICNLNVGLDHCGRMEHINIKDIVECLNNNNDKI
jgi:hypothetical protein|tara:strand:+ start:37 stop:867 length:831 start_codon:yes stop_codon:yes gene_type:complete